MLDILLQAALTSGQIVGNYVTAGSIYTENTVIVILTMLTVLALSIQIARRYFIRILRKFTLRFAADIWWLIYVLLRDASIFLVVFLGVMLFWPGIYQDFPIAVPFMPLAVEGMCDTSNIETMTFVLGDNAPTSVLSDRS